jgi:hypothetical protein
MNLIKKTVLTFFVASSLTAGNAAFAEDAKAAEVIAHIEAALKSLNTISMPLLPMKKLHVTLLRKSPATKPLRNKATKA